MEVDKDDYESKSIVDYYFKDGILLLRARYVGDTLGKDNIMEVTFEDLNMDVPFEIVIYIKKYVVETSRIKGPFIAWAVKVLKSHIRAIRRL